MTDVLAFQSVIFDSSQFKHWKKDHSRARVSHFFCALTSAGGEKSLWEVGFFDPAERKITVFVQDETGEIIIKPADDVFTAGAPDVEELKLDKNIISLPEAWNVWQEKKEELFSKEIMGDGFVILQCFQGKTLWNITFITKSLKFANLKIDAVTKTVLSHQLVELVQK